MSLPVGKDIESMCGKCGDVWHVVVAKLGEKIAKVQCKQCGAVHGYRPLHKEKMKKEKAARSPSAAKERATRVAAAAGPRVVPTPNKPMRAYKPRESFEPGDSISHPTFGQGIVELVTLDGKIEVFFPDQRRTLVHARGGAGPVSSAPALPARRAPSTGSDD